jgi:hypothetical protein
VTALAEHDAYYVMLNGIVRKTPELLDNEFSFLFAQRGLLDFENKLAWLRRKVCELRANQNASVGGGGLYDEVSGWMGARDHHYSRHQPFKLTVNRTGVFTSIHHGQ